MFSNSTNDLGICCNTWPKDAHGLFDYESETINTMEKTLGKGGKITRDSELNETQYYPTKQDDGFFLTGATISPCTPPPDALAFFYSDSTSLIKLSKNIDNQYIYNKENIMKVQEKFWYVLAQMETKGIRKEYLSNYKYSFGLNDIVRFGRVQFVVRQINEGNNLNKNDTLPLFLPNETPVEGNDKPCSICQKSDGDTNKLTNPVVKICQCKESPYMHVECFKNFLKTSKSFAYKDAQFANKKVTLIKLYNFICSNCNEPYNAILKKNGREYNILPYENPGGEVPHLVLESLNFVKEGIFIALIMIFIFPKKKEEYYLGRGHEATFKVSDISISRVHCKIYMQNNKILLDDLGSKFGTLVLMRNKDLEVEEMLKKKIKIQTGISVFWIKQ